MIVMMAILALTIDTGYMYSMQTQLDRAVDAAALAGAASLEEGQDIANQKAVEYLVRNPVGTGPVTNNELGQQMSEFLADHKNDYTIKTGTWNDVTGKLEPSAQLPSAISVDMTYPNMPLFFGRALGKNTFQIHSRATAMFQPRDIMVVLDFSGSMNDDSELKSINRFGRQTIMSGLSQIYRELGSPTYGKMQFDPQYISVTKSYATVEYRYTSVNITATKKVSTVKLEFPQGRSQTFNGLSTRAVTLAGTGKYKGQPIYKVVIGQETKGKSHQSNYNKRGSNESKSHESKSHKSKSHKSKSHKSKSGKSKSGKSKSGKSKSGKSKSHKSKSHKSKSHKSKSQGSSSRKKASSSKKKASSSKSGSKKSSSGGGNSSKSHGSGGLPPGVYGNWYGPSAANRVLVFDFNPKTINRTIKTALKLDSVRYPYKAATWDSYIDYCKTGYYNKKAGFHYMFGYANLINYWLEQKCRYSQTPDLWKVSAYPVTAVKDAVDVFMDYVRQVDTNDRVGLVVYDSNSGDAVLEEPLTRNLDRVVATARHRQAGHYHSMTNIGAGMMTARRHLEAIARRGAFKMMVLMTDGQANWYRGRYNVSAARQQVISEAYSAADLNYPVVAISLGGGADTGLMDKVADITKSKHFNVPGGQSVAKYRQDLIQVFQDIAAARPLKIVQ